MFAKCLHSATVLGAAGEGVDHALVPVTVWEHKLLGFWRYLFRYGYDSKCRQSPANAESGDWCTIATNRILTGIFFVV